MQNEILKLKDVVVDDNKIDLRISHDNYRKVENAIFKGLFEWEISVGKRFGIKL